MKTGSRPLEWVSLAKKNISKAYNFSEKSTAEQILEYLDSYFEEYDSLKNLDESIFLYLEIFRLRFGFNIIFSGNSFTRRVILQNNNGLHLDPLKPIYEAFENQTILAEEDFFRSILIRELIHICSNFHGFGKYPEIDSIFEKILIDDDFEEVQSQRNTFQLEELLIEDNEFNPLTLRRNAEIPLKIFNIINRQGKGVRPEWH